MDLSFFLDDTWSSCGEVGYIPVISQMKSSFADEEMTGEILLFVMLNLIDLVLLHLILLYFIWSK